MTVALRGRGCRKVQIWWGSGLVYLRVRIILAGRERNARWLVGSDQGFGRAVRGRAWLDWPWSGGRVGRTPDGGELRRTGSELPCGFRGAGQMSTSTGRETADRQRQRAERGVGTTRKPGGRLPSNRKRRRPAVAALAALLIVGGALIAGLLAIRMDEREAVIQIAQNVGAGQKIEKADLAETRVAGDSLRLIPVHDASKIIGTYATVNLLKGQLLNEGQFTAESPIADGKAEVGIVLVGGRIPAGGLQTGDLVELIKIGNGTTAPVSLGTGMVLEISKQAASGSGLGEKSTAAQSATVLVDQPLVKAVADASGNNRIAVAVIKRGTSIGSK